jgi:hypothetical protein
MTNCMELAFKPFLIAALSLAYSFNASAGDIPKDEAGFTDYVAKQFRVEIGDSAVVVKSPLTLGIGNLQANLDRIYTFCRQNNDGCSRDMSPSTSPCSSYTARPSAWPAAK